MDNTELSLLYSGYGASAQAFPQTSREVSQRTVVRMELDGLTHVSPPGYQVRFVEYEAQGTAHMGGNDAADHAIHENMAASMDWCVDPSPTPSSTSSSSARCLGVAPLLDVI